MLRRLIARADVFLHNLAPGAMSRLGFGVGDAARRSIRGWWSARSPVTARRDRTATRRPTTCSCRARPASSRSPARRRRRRRSASRSPTSPRACTRSPASWRRCCVVSGRATARRSTSRCSTRWPSGWDIPAYYTGYGGAPLPRSGARTRGDRALRAVHRRRRARSSTWDSRTSVSGRGSARRARAAGTGRRSPVQLEREARRRSATRWTP